MFDRDIPLTKSGNPNMRYLSTEERKIYKEYLELKLQLNKDQLNNHNNRV